jgi:hypothetical protein
MTLFLSQLWSALHDPHIQVRRESATAYFQADSQTFCIYLAQHAVHWNEAGDGFIISDVHAFEQQVLPAYYKHKWVDCGLGYSAGLACCNTLPSLSNRSRYSSFLRSLSYYSFIKAASPDHVEYTHAIFHRGSPDCLTRIQRKPTTSSKHPASSSRGGRGRGGSGAKRHRRAADDDEGDDDDADFGGGEGEGGVLVVVMERGTATRCTARAPSPPPQRPCAGLRA